MTTVSMLMKWATRWLIWFWCAKDPMRMNSTLMMKGEGLVIFIPGWSIVFSLLTSISRMKASSTASSTSVSPYSASIVPRFTTPSTCWMWSTDLQFCRMSWKLSGSHLNKSQLRACSWSSLFTCTHLSPSSTSKTTCTIGASMDMIVTSSARITV